MEVRCFRDANKLLGSLPVRDDLRGGQQMAFVVMKPARRTVEDMKASHERSSPTKWLYLQAKSWHAQKHGQLVHQGVALNADGVLLQTLRLIPGFIEAGAPPLASLTTKETP